MRGDTRGNHCPWCTSTAWPGQAVFACRTVNLLQIHTTTGSYNLFDYRNRARFMQHFRPDILPWLAVLETVLTIPTSKAGRGLYYYTFDLASGQFNHTYSTGQHKQPKIHQQLSNPGFQPLDQEGAAPLGNKPLHTPFLCTTFITHILFTGICLNKKISGSIPRISTATTGPRNLAGKTQQGSFTLLALTS